MIVINGKNYKELRCVKCQRFIIYQNISAGILATQCDKCDFMNEWSFKYLNTADNVAEIKKKYELEIRQSEMKGGEI